MQQQITIASARPVSMPTLEMGWQYYQAGQYAQAETVFRQFLEANPEHAQAWRLLGLTCQAQNRLPEAEANYRQSLCLQAGDAEAHNDLGVALAKQGNFVHALASFEQATGLQPNYMVAHNNLVQVLFQQGQPEKAALHACEVVRLLPGNADAHNLMGVVLARQGQFDQAINSFEQALVIKPDNPVARANLDKSRFVVQNQLRNATNQLLGAIYFNQIMSTAPRKNKMVNLSFDAERWNSSIRRGSARALCLIVPFGPCSL